ncbi:MAG: ABC transporter permease subunit [Candidatus Nitronauta litoralis]|uniref:ABC transporter permease subunit n=1 Tax=Candidatus Nitronauta litoralis TaxID=2705533 RepID=A0A7T0G1Z4_9BACT|nr:MAG: ABC transporter permease subunit [Candidatus Nitronauta litoralis]
MISKDLSLKLDRFKADRRAWYSFTILTFLFLISLPAELLCNIRPLVMTVDGKWYFPIAFTYSWKDFGGESPAEPDYKSREFIQLFGTTFDEQEQDSLPSPIQSTPEESAMSLDDFEEEFSTEESADESGGMGLNFGDFDETEEPTLFIIEMSDFDEDTNSEITDAAFSSTTTASKKQERDVWMLWPPIRYDYKYIPSESKAGQVALASPVETFSPHLEQTLPSSWVDGHYLGTDDRGRDVLARLIYGFRISMVFGLSLAITGTLIGCLLGGIQGYFGGWVDLIGQRLTEIWGSMPRLYILIILSALLTPSGLLLFMILNLTAWMGIAAYIRAEFLKSRNLEYVKAARALGVSNFSIMKNHILPNSLTPVITFFPFEVTAGILALVSLDFLNLGVPSPAPSIGELLAQGKTNLQALWILLPTFFVLTTTLTLLTFVGDGIRNAFDPKKSV